MRTTNHNRRLRRRATAAVVLALLATSCGSSSNSSSSSAAAVTAATTAATAATAATTSGSGSGSGGTVAAAGTTMPGATPSSATPVPADAKVLTIADLESLTGAAASVGVPQSNAVKMAVDEINANGGLTVGGTVYKLELDTQDDQSDPTAGVTAVQKFLSDGRHYMVGTLSSAVVGAYLPIVQDSADFVSIVMGAALEGITDHPSMYRPRVTLSQYTTGLSDYLAQLGTVKTIALLTDNQHAGFVQQLDPFKAALTAKGITVTSDERYKFGDTEFGAQLTSMLRDKPDALNFRGYPGDVTRIIKQAREQGFTGPIFTTSGITQKEVGDAQSAAAMDGVVEVYAPLPSDLIEGGRNADVAKAFEDNYEATFGEPSGGTSMSAYDGVYILAAALEKAGTVDDVGKVRAALDALTLSDVPQLVEPLKPQASDHIFTNHQAYFVLVVRSWSNGAFHPDSFVD